MQCAWNEFLAVVPHRLRSEVDRLGKDSLEELRLRCGQPVVLIRCGSPLLLKTAATADDIHFAVNSASRYSPWSAATARDGYITAPGGHRIGICGDCVLQNGEITGIRTAQSVCMRVARDFPGIATTAPREGSLLIVGPPGVGKTTLLRDLIRNRARQGCSVAVVDERGEIFPEASNFPFGSRTDVLRGCSKADGLEMLLRTMGPSTIAVDEISSAGDCRSLVNAAWCGVDLMATAHAASVKELQTRQVYKPLIGCRIFDTLIIMRKDKSWYVERMAHG